MEFLSTGMFVSYVRQRKHTKNVVLTLNLKLFCHHEGVSSARIPKLVVYTDINLSSTELWIEILCFFFSMRPLMRALFTVHD